jgi:hypothetical protein
MEDCPECQYAVEAQFISTDLIGARRVIDNFPGFGDENIRPIAGGMFRVGQFEMSHRKHRGNSAPIGSELTQQLACEEPALFADFRER